VVDARQRDHRRRARIVLDVIVFSSLPTQAAADASAQLHLPAGYWVVTVILWIYGLATIVPNYAVLFRRLHDTNRSGWWWLIGLIPFVGGIILIVFTALPSEPAGSRFDHPNAY
jgi:uncharacterized membrane protein YhaH (DUF805 family)